MRILLRALARVVEAGDVLEFKKPAKKSGSKPKPKPKPSSGPGVSYEDQKANRERARQVNNERITKNLKSPSSGGGGGGGQQPQRDPYKEDDFELRPNPGAVDRIVVDALSSAWEDLHADYGNDLVHYETKTDEDTYYRVMGMGMSHAMGSGYYPATLADEIQEEYNYAHEVAQEKIWQEHEDVLEENGLSESKIDYNTLSDINSDLAEQYDEIRDDEVSDISYLISMGVWIKDEAVVVFSNAELGKDLAGVDDPNHASFEEEVTFDSPQELKTMLREALVNAVKAMKSN